MRTKEQLLIELGLAKDARSRAYDACRTLPQGSPWVMDCHQDYYTQDRWVLRVEKELKALEESEAK